VIQPNLITAPTTETISEEELKFQLSMTDSDDVTDTNLSIYRKAAREYHESRTGRTIHETEWELVLNAFPGGDRIELPRATPLISITSIKYFDSDGTENTFSDSNYIVDTWSRPGCAVLAYNESWPSFTAYPVAPVRVRYKAGIATSPTTEADDADKLPVLLLAAALYENREAVNVADRASIAQISAKYGIEAFILLRQVRHLFPNE
jgi:uncharacterized phiE125 gp8 family phage protein